MRKLTDLCALISIPLLVLFLVHNAPAWAQEFPPKPDRKNFFVDEAGLISPEHREEINLIAGALLEEEEVPLIVVTIPSLVKYQAAAFTVDNYATLLFDHWGLGSENRNYGMLLLVSVGDRRARIELGASWSRSHDAQAQEVMDSLIIREFKRDDFSGGILAGVRGMDALARGLQLPQAKTPWWALPLFLLLIALIIGVIVSLFKSGRRGWGWALIAALGVLLFFMLRSAMKSGGSGGAFGGGFSGGGGAGGSW